VGWSPWLLERHCRWEVFELIRPEPAACEAPHLEDVWVAALKPRRRLAEPAVRRAVLTATAGRPNEPLFGAPLTPTRAAAYLEPKTGQRSLATLVLPAAQVRFSVTRRDGVLEPDVRVTLPLPGLGERTMPVKDHYLLLRAEQAGAPLEAQEAALL